MFECCAHLRSAWRLRLHGRLITLRCWEVLEENARLPIWTPTGAWQHDERGMQIWLFGAAACARVVLRVLPGMDTVRI